MRGFMLIRINVHLPLVSLPVYPHWCFYYSRQQGNKMTAFNGVDMQVLGSSGREDVAEIFVARFRGEDGPVLEFVDGLDTRYKREEKWIVNVSTQFGCPVNCIFCDAGGEYKGNCSVEEMLAQADYVLQRHKGLAQQCGKLKVHFARMGEPALNDNVIEAMRALPTLTELENAKALWCCVPTTAPRGRNRWFDNLKEMKDELYHGRFQLQFSVNSTDEAERDRLMPHPHLTMKEIAVVGEDFFEPGDRKPVLNFALAANVPFDQKAISTIFNPEKFAIKLTPLNPTSRGIENGLETILRSDREKQLQDVCDGLSELNYDVIISIGDGREDEIGSNCGQAVRRMGLFGNK